MSTHSPTQTDRPDPSFRPDPGDNRTIRVAMIGCGTVGGGVVRILDSLRGGLLEQRAGCGIVLKTVVVRDPKRPRDLPLQGIQVTSCMEDVLEDKELDVVIEVMGGVDPTADIVQRLLQSGRDLITANKALLYQHGTELFQTARAHQRTICFEAAVAGGIPIVSALNQALTANRVRALEAILNGTSNFILSRMLDCGQTYDEVLQEAQRRGYAEADPSMDVNGTDAAQKLSLLTRLAFGTPVRIEQFVCQGIQDIQLLDLQTARELGYRVKLLATSRMSGDALEVAVQPTLVRADRAVAQTNGADNIIAIEGDAVGLIRLSGAGAGQLPTASAIVADLIDYATGRAAPTFRSILRQEERMPLTLVPSESLSRRYYLRYTVADQPHVLADVADILGRHEISISSVHQDETPEEQDEDSGVARLVIMTHRTTEGRVACAGAEISRLPSMRGTSIRMPVAD